MRFGVHFLLITAVCLPRHQVQAVTSSKWTTIVIAPRMTRKTPARAPHLHSKLPAKVAAGSDEESLGQSLPPRHEQTLRALRPQDLARSVLPQLLPDEVLERLSAGRENAADGLRGDRELHFSGVGGDGDYRGRGTSRAPQVGRFAECLWRVEVRAGGRYMCLCVVSVMSGHIRFFRSVCR